MDESRGFGEHARVPTLEGVLIRKWRQSLGLTQEKVGAGCPTPISGHRVYDIEAGRSSASVETLLNVIRGLERASRRRIGTSDQQRLVAFFQGPDLSEQRRMSARQLRELADQIEGREPSA